MDLILLGGQDSHNKEWIEDVDRSLSNLFSKSYIQYYNNWQNSNLPFEIEKEEIKLTQLAENKKDFVVFAKSAGSLLALKGIYEKVITPKACIFCGLGYSFSKQNQYPLIDWLESFTIPTLFIQKTNDPQIHSDHLKELLVQRNIKNFTLIEIEGEDHHYPNIDEIYKQTAIFLSKL